MKYNEPGYRKAQRDSFCRACDKKIKRDVDYMATWYSFRGTGQHIHICTECVSALYKLVTEGGDV